MALTKSEILYTLHLSKNKGIAISIKLRHQESSIVTSVEEVINDIVVVKPVNLHGVSLPRTSFYLDEIEHVKSMKILFNAPLYVHLRNLKANIKSMQERMTWMSHEKVES
jgi:hypothetical protein